MGKVSSIVIIVILAIVVLKFVPLKTVTEDYGSKSFTLSPYESWATTTLNAKKGGTISGSFSESKGNQVSFSITTNNAVPTTVYQVTASSGSFSFTSDTDQSYIVYMRNPTFGTTITVTLQAKQTTMTTFF